MKKKILTIAPGSYIGGAEKVTLDILQGLKDKGISNYCIINGWNDGEFTSRVQSIGVNFSELKLGWYYFSKLKWSLISLCNYPLAVLKFLKIQKKIKHDLIYITSYRFIVLLYPFLKSNIIYHVHDPSSTNRQSRLFIKLINSKVVKFIAVSDFIKKDLIKCGIPEKKIEVIHNGVDLPIKPLKHNTLNGILTIGIVGQIIPRKGHEDVIEALSILFNKGYINIKLTVVGKGDTDFEAELKVLAHKLGVQNLITWKGYHKAADKIFEGIDIVVAPTRNAEPFALVPLEANSFGIPVIVSERGGFPEMVRDGENGFIIEAHNPADIALKLEILLQNSDLRADMGIKGRELINNKFTKEKMINRFINHLDSLNIK